MPDKPIACWVGQGWYPAEPWAAGRICTCNPPFEGDGEICRCPSGTVFDRFGTCAEIDGCQEYPCPQHADCTDIADPPAPEDGKSGRQCSCDIGYEFVDMSMTGVELGVQCVDSNACSRNECHASAVCVDLPPPAPSSLLGRECICDAGLTMDDKGACVDVDECLVDPVTFLDIRKTEELCGPNAKCSDVKAPYSGYDCECLPGFAKQGGPNSHCADIDACLKNPCESAAYKCVDLDGELDGPNGRKCVDVDACSTAPCHSTATCQDLPDMPPDWTGRTCVCKPGFRGPVDTTRSLCCDETLTSPPVGGDNQCWLDYMRHTTTAAAITEASTSDGDSDNGSLLLLAIVVIIVLVICITVNIGVTTVLYSKCVLPP